MYVPLCAIMCHYVPIKKFCETQNTCFTNFQICAVFVSLCAVLLLKKCAVLCHYVPFCIFRRHPLLIMLIIIHFLFVNYYADTTIVASPQTQLIFSYRIYLIILLISHDGPKRQNIKRFVSLVRYMRTNPIAESIGSPLNLSIIVLIYIRQ